MIPGPVKVSERVRKAMSRPLLSHVSEEFAQITIETIEMLKEIFETKNDMVIAPGSSSMGLDAVMASIIEPGDNVLVVSSGYYADRIVGMVQRHGGKAEKVESNVRESVEITKLKEKLEEKPDIKALAVVHVETSSGVKNPIEKIGEIASKRGIIYIVDAVSSVGGMEVLTDQWGIDLCVGGPQKCLSAPPGLSLLSVSGKALETMESRKKPIDSFYLDLMGWIPSMRDPLSRYVTQSIPLVFALREAVEIVLEEGLGERFRRHQNMAEAIREAIKAIGLKLFPRERDAADTLTVFETPSSVSGETIRRIMLEKFKIRIAGGWGEFKETVLRIGHMGQVMPIDIIATTTALELSLKEAGLDVKLGNGVIAVEDVLRKYL